MNTKIVAIGSLVVILLFGLGFWWLTQTRSAQLQSTLSQNTTTFTGSAVDISPQAKQAAKAETYSLEILQRGTVVAVNTNANIMSVLTVTKDKNGQNVETLRDISVAGVTQALCWPEFFPSSDGKQIPIKEAYFPLTATSILYLENQTTKPLASIINQITGKFAFFHLKSTSYSDTVLPEAKELAILNCP